MDYKLILPDGYKKVPFPGLNTWIADLRANADKQGSGLLCNGEKYCCLGRLSFLQDRLHWDSVSKFFVDCDHSPSVLSNTNPYYKLIAGHGHLPIGVYVAAQGYNSYSYLAKLNDLGFSFLDIADILEQVYEDAGEILK